MFGGQSITISSYWSLMGLIDSLSTYSLPGVDESSTSAPAKSKLLGSSESFSSECSGRLLRLFVIEKNVVDCR